MLPNLQSANFEPSPKSLCCYTNSTREMQIVLVPDSRNHDSEKVIFPQQKILFEAFPDQQLEIHTCDRAGASKKTQVIACKNLQIDLLWQ